MFRSTLTLCLLSLLGSLGCQSETLPNEPGLAHFGVDPTMQNEPTTNPNDASGQPGSNLPGTTPPPTSNPNPAAGDPGVSCADTYQAVSACYDAYYECSAPCQDQACADACKPAYETCFNAEVAKASQEGKQDFEDLRACEDTHWQSCYDKGGEVFNSCSSSCSDDACVDACADEATAVLQSCMSTQCQSEYDRCGLLDEVSEPENSNPQDTPPANPGATGDTACGQLYACEDACNGDFDCGKNCYDSADANAQQHWNELIQCGQTECNNQVDNAAQYKACLQQKCGSEYATCFDPSVAGSTPDPSNPPAGAPGTGPSGTGTCSGGYDCILNCYGVATSEQEFYACVDGCDAKMSLTAKGLMDALAQCTNVQCAGVPGSFENYLKCQKDFCPNEYNACMNDG